MSQQKQTMGNFQVVYSSQPVHDYQSTNSPHSSQSQYNQILVCRKLLTNLLPKFVGNYQNWLEYHDSLQSIVI